MINIQFNDEWLTLDTPCTLADFLDQKNYRQNYYAVAINQVFISRSQYESTILKEADFVELVFPMQGG